MKKDKRFIQSEKAIIEASIETFSLNPAAGMSEIAAAAGVGRATLYRHFESREALIEKLAIICLEQLNTVTAPLKQLSGRAAIEAEIEAVMPLADRFQFLIKLWTIAADSDIVKQIDEQQRNELATVIEQAKEAGEIAPQLPTVWIVSFYESTLATAWSLIASEKITIDEAVAYTKQSFFQGVKK